MMQHRNAKTTAIYAARMLTEVGQLSCGVAAAPLRSREHHMIL